MRNKSKTYKKYHSLIDKLISANKKFRENHTYGDMRRFSIRDYAKEYCTVKCDIGRRTGKTSYIRDRAKENDLVVVRDMTQMQNYADIAERVQIATVHDVLSIETINLLGWYETIYLDDIGFSREPFDEVLFQLYEKFAYPREKSQTFVFLGKS